MMHVKAWWHLGVALAVAACHSPEPGEEGGSSETGEPELRSGWVDVPVVEDIAAPLRLRVGEESRAKLPLLVFSPARLPDEEIEGVVLVVGAELSATNGRLRGVEEAKVEEVDGVVEISPTARAGQLPRIPLEEPWTDLGRAVTRLSRVTATVEALELADYETALWVVRGRVRVLSGPIEVTARDFFWEPDVSRILLAAEEEERPLTLKATKPRPEPRPPGKLGANGPGRPPTIGGGHGLPGGDPPAPSGGAIDAGTPTGPSGHVPGFLWPRWPTTPEPRAVAPAPGEEEGPALPGEVPAWPTPTLPPTAVLLGEEPLPAPPTPEPGVVQCIDSTDCDGGRCVLLAFDGGYVQQCSEECADGASLLCVDDAGCCDIDLVCTEAGTCVQPGQGEESETNNNSGCGDSNGCNAGCQDPYTSGCGNGLNEGCNSTGEGCGGNNSGSGCSGGSSSSSNSGCGGSDGGSSGSSSGCGGGSDGGSGSSSSGCGGGSDGGSSSSSSGCGGGSDGGSSGSSGSSGCGGGDSGGSSGSSGCGGGSSGGSSGSSGCGGGDSGGSSGSSGCGGGGSSGGSSSSSGCGGSSGGGSSGGSSSSSGCGGGSSGGSSGGCGGSSGGGSSGGGGAFCQIPRPQRHGGGWGMSMLCWLSVFLVVKPRRRRVG